ncbi:hypothetical protein [Clostridium thailandense]|uniref:hypothetical protein n=1 Tax=Clostridium thailandense TaxID=2794346 RepID=UPI003989DB2F
MVFVTNYLYNLVLKNKIEESYTKMEKLLLSKLKFDNDTDKKIINRNKTLTL